ncbi:hypothetical protein MIR68_005893 [Amoeboaphelidium protococcarum]|nr:hypothetical protein MIR68_005893 [Amoeboaphelidium protococcarum]
MSESNKSGDASVGVDKAPRETNQVKQESNQQVPAPQSTLNKQGLVDAAVKFMLDPKVSNAPMAKKMAFLESKGLSPDDIQQVMKIVYSQSSPSANSEQSNVQSYNASSQPPPLPQYPSNAAAMVHPYPGPSLYNSRARMWVDMFIVSAFASSLAVAGYHAVQKYFGQSLPQWMRLTEGKDSASLDVEQKWEAAIDKAMERHIAQTQNQIKTQLESQITQLQSSLSDLIERQIVSNNNNINSYVGEFDAQDVVLKVNEVKSEIKSLKALLLSRKSFAAMPQSSPAIIATSSTSAAASSSDSAMVDDKPTLADNAQVSSMLPKWQMEDDALDKLDDGESAAVDESLKINKEYTSDDPIKSSLVMQSEQ